MSETARMKTTTGMAFSLGDVIDRGYYLEPSYKTRSGALPENTNTSDISKYLAEKEESLAVLGQPGSGKSTLLGKLFLDAAENARGDKSCCLPLFVLLRGRGATFEFDLYKYLEHSFNSLLQKELYPLLDLADFKFVLYIDGFDELTEDVNSLNTSLVFNSNMFDCQFIISCRKRFALEHLDQTDVGDKISVSIELESWDIDQIAEYIDRFCKLNDCGDMKVAIIEAFSGSFADDEVTANQLLLTLFLWIVEESGMKVPLDVSDKTSLFDKTLELWAKRELVRTGEEVDSDDLIAAWKIAAWHIYCSRYDTNGPLTLEILRQKIETNSEGLGIVCTKEAFNGLLDVRPYTQKILGLLHEQILEHLAAHAIFNGIYSNSYPFPESLSYVVRHDINRIVRGFWEDGSVDKQVILDNLNNHYVSIAQNDDSASILQRNQAAYYMGRLGTENAIEKLRLIDDTEDNLVVKLSIAFGLIGCGQFDYEATLLQNLKDNGDWDKANRGYHLVYYHDWRIQEIAPPYLDPEDIPWSNTLRSLMRHIESTSFQHIALRRVEIYTIRRFLETRGTKGPLDDDVIMKLEASVGNIPSETVPKLEGDFITNLEEEIAELRKVYDSM